MIGIQIFDKERVSRIAIVESGREITYGELADKARGIRQALPQKGIIAILLPNGGDFIAAICAAELPETTIFPLSVLLTKHELISLLARVSASAVVTSESFRPLFAEMAWDVIPPILYIEKLSSDNGCECSETQERNGDKPAVLLATSGTMGKPKIVQLSRRSIETSFHGYIEKMRFSEDDGENRFILAAPFFTAYGLMILCACLTKAYPVIVLEEPFTLDALYHAAETHRATHYEGGVTPLLLMEQMAERPNPYDIRSLKCFGFGGSKISGETLIKLKKAYPQMEFFQGYGMTEASPLITKFDRAQPVKPDSVGTAIKGVTVAVEADGEITEQPFIKGEVVVKGPNVMLGYFQDEAETNKAIQDDWLYTGDIGYLDEEGYLFLCGRRKNVIIVRGFNVHAEEVEECIINSPFARDCHVYGRADSFGNETVCADIVPAFLEVSEEAVKEYCAARLAAYKRPQMIRFCEEILKNASGKTARQVKEEKGGER